MRVLIVGAGAVGQVYGHHLGRGGADVCFLVKPKYREAAQQGFQMYRLHSIRAPQTIRFDGFGVLDKVSDVENTAWDQVWLTIPADAVVGAWLDELVAGLSDQCVIVCLSPGYETYQRLTALVGSARLVLGMINLISYQAPLSTETRFRKPGVAFWLPPFTASPFSGPSAAVDTICRTLRAGGQRATPHPDVQQAVEIPQAILMTHLLALERNDWSFAKLRRGTALAEARRGALEAMAIMAAKKTKRGAWWTSAWRPFMGRWGLWFAPHLVPLDLESYIRFHFTKVRPQTILFIEQYLAWGDELQLPTQALASLLDGISN